jgi:hypothetical protein
MPMEKKCGEWLLAASIGHLRRHAMISIDSRRHQAVTLLRQFGLAPFRAMLPPATFAEVAADADCAAQRERALTPEVTVWLMLCVAVQTASMTQGLAQSWGWVCVACPWLSGPSVTESAFCQARQRLSLRFWRQLWNTLHRRYEQHFPQALRWRGLRLLACDGTEVKLPNTPALGRYFSRPRTKLGECKAPQGRLVALCSVLTGFCCDFEFISRRCSEHLALKHLIRRLRENDLLLLDRGFFSLYGAIPDSPAPGPLSTARARQRGPLCATA